MANTRYRAMSHNMEGQARVGESQVVKLWQHQLLGGVSMVTEEGEPIRIVYPGRLNDGRGADFRDVVIATDRGLMKGEVEVHVKSSSWRAHRHHQDPAYNQVILHVVMWQMQNSHLAVVS